VRYSPGIRTLLLPSALLTFFASSSWALAQLRKPMGSVAFADSTPESHQRT